MPIVLAAAIPFLDGKPVHAQDPAGGGSGASIEESLVNLESEDIQEQGIDVGDIQSESRRIFPLSALTPEEREALDKEEREYAALLDLQTQVSRVLEVSGDLSSYLLERSDERALELGFENTTQVLSYLRFVAFSMETLEMRDAVLNGLVQAFLLLEKPDLAEQEMELQESIFWKIRSRNNFARYYIEKGEITAASQELQKVPKLLRDYRVAQARAAINKDGGLLERQVEAGSLNLNDAVSESVRLMGYIGDLFQAITLADFVDLRSERSKLVMGLVRDAVNSPENYAVDIPISILTLILGGEFDRLSKNPLGSPVEVYAELAELANALGERQKAQEILSFARDAIIREAPVGEQSRKLLAIIPSFVRVGLFAEAVQTSRLLKSETVLALALARMGQAAGRYGNIDAAAPLFFYAVDIALSTSVSINRDDLFADISSSQAAIGRFRDSFTTARYIENPDIKRETYRKLAESLIVFSQLDDARQLVRGYLSLLSRRVPLLTAIAVKRFEIGRNPDQFYQDLKLAYTRSGDADSLQGLQVEALLPVIQAQLKYGAPENDNEVFGGLRDLVISVDDAYLQTFTILEIARALRERGKIGEARRMLNTALQIAVSSRHDTEQFTQAVLDIIDIQILLQDLLGAFDSLALLSDSRVAQFLLSPSEQQSQSVAGAGIPLQEFSNSKRYEGLQKLARAAVASGEVELAMRAANDVEVGDVRADTYSQIAIGLAGYINRLLGADGAGGADEALSDEPLAVGAAVSVNRN